MKLAGNLVITVGAQHIQRLILPMLQQRFDYLLCHTKNSRLKCNLSLLPRYRNSPRLNYLTLHSVIHYIKIENYSHKY